MAYHAPNAVYRARSAPVRGKGPICMAGREKYLDFASGIGSTCSARPPAPTKAIQEQAATLIHVSNLMAARRVKSSRSGW